MVPQSEMNFGVVSGNHGMLELAATRDDSSSVVCQSKPLLHEKQFVCQVPALLTHALAVLSLYPL